MLFSYLLIYIYSKFHKFIRIRTRKIHLVFNHSQLLHGAMADPPVGASVTTTPLKNAVIEKYWEIIVTNRESF